MNLSIGDILSLPSPLRIKLNYNDQLVVSKLKDNSLIFSMLIHKLSPIKPGGGWDKSYMCSHSLANNYKYKKQLQIAKVSKVIRVGVGMVGQKSK